MRDHVLIVGYRGNMGQRYSAILDYLKVSWVGTDENHSLMTTREKAKGARGIIIATPTSTHEVILDHLIDLGIPILCEKPITKNVDNLKALLDKCEFYRTPLRMVYQYSMLASHKPNETTYYDYYKHGGDGLIWDCIQIIGLAKGKVFLNEESPLWTCRINGKELSLSDMDQAYIDYISLWLDEPNQSLKEIMHVHEKTAKYERELNGLTH